VKPIDPGPDPFTTDEMVRLLADAVEATDELLQTRLTDADVEAKLAHLHRMSATPTNAPEWLDDPLLLTDVAVRDADQQLAVWSAQQQVDLARQEAAAVRSRAERDAEAIRQQARYTADQTVHHAQARAASIIAAANEQRHQAQQEADAYRAETERAAMLRTEAAERAASEAVTIGWAKAAKHRQTVARHLFQLEQRAIEVQRQAYVEAAEIETRALSIETRALNYARDLRASSEAMARATAGCAAELLDELVQILGPLHEMTKSRRRRWRYALGMPEDTYDDLLGAAHRIETLALSLIDAGAAWHNTSNTQLAAPLPEDDARARHRTDVEAEIAAMQAPTFSVENLFESHKRFGTTYAARRSISDYTVKVLPAPMSEVLDRLQGVDKPASATAHATDPDRQATHEASDDLGHVAQSV
jgi:hypothetical protein